SRAHRGNRMKRRSVLAMTTALAAAATCATGARAETTCTDAEALSLATSQKLFGDDGLARPVPGAPTKSDLASGLDRTLVLGGGGEYYVAWYCGFFHGLLELGVDTTKQAEMVVGTSAGAYIGSSMTSGHFQRLRAELNFFGHFPSLFGKIAPVSTSNAS